MRKILRVFVVVALLVVFGLSILSLTRWHQRRVAEEAIMLFVVSEQYVAESFYDRARAMDRVAHYQAGFDGIRRALLKCGVSFNTTTIPKDADIYELQLLFAAELARATLQLNNDNPWPLAYEAASVMCASLQDSHTAIAQPTPVFALPVATRVLEGNLGLLVVRAFNPDYMHRFPDVVRDLEQRACRGIILDLRDSVGGDIQTMFALISCFIPPGTPLFATKTDYVASLVVSTGGYQTSLPLVVLVNRESYSAAEMLAEVLQRSGRARLVGERTAGHFGVSTGWVVDPFRGVVLQVTTHTHLTFGGANLEGVGVLPDIMVVDAPTQTGGAQLDAARIELERLIIQKK